MIEAPNGCSEVAGFSKPRSTETLSSVFSFLFFFSQGVSSEKEIDCLQLGIIFPFIIVKK